MEAEHQLTVLGALLHDIGKFAQRAKQPCTKRLADDYLPKRRDGVSTHWHALYTDYFIEKKALRLPAGLSEHRSKLAGIAARHHKPFKENPCDMCIHVADGLSAGVDRPPVEDPSDAGGDFRRQRLISVFSGVSLPQPEAEAPSARYHGFSELKPDEGVFPNNPDPLTDSEKEYADLFDRFENDLMKFPENLPFTAYLEGLKALLERYTWCVPSATWKTTPDVSLFDHALSTAALAQALYVHHRESGTHPGDTAPNAEFLLYGGDISGIQDYIFNVAKNTGKGVSKIFRARSFHLQAIVESVKIALHRRLGLAPVTALIDSGGKFVLVLPNTPAIVEKLAAFDADVQEFFRESFQGLLTLALSEPLAARRADFKAENFRDALDRVGESVEAAKLRKLHKTMAEGPVLTVKTEDFRNGVCPVCDIRPVEPEASAEAEREICGVCRSQIQYIGTQLPKAKYLVYAEADCGADGEADSDKLKLFDNISLTINTGGTKPPINDSLYRLYTLEAFESGFPKVRMTRHLPTYREDEIAGLLKIRGEDERDEEGETIRAGETKNFADIAAKAVSVQDGKPNLGRKLLAFFKADVDNLGIIFSQGLAHPTPARLASLSRMLDFFFAEYLTEYLKKNHPDIYVVFGGGDDLFLLGPWDDVLKFAGQMREKLHRFCAKNRTLTLSAGILAARPHYPMRHAARDVEAKLKEAKNAKSSWKKDRVSFIGEPVSWEEFSGLLKTGEKLDKFTKAQANTNYTAAFLYRLLEYHRMYRRFRGGDIRAGLYLSHAHYDIARNIRGEKKTDAAPEVQFLLNIFTVGTKTKQKLERFDIPLFIAINQNRKL